MGHTNLEWNGGISVACVWCSVSFTTCPSKIKGGRGRFCSRICASKWKSANYKGRKGKRLCGDANPNWRGRSVLRPCIVCFQLFAKPTLTCSKECGHKLQAIKISKEGNGNWISESKWLEGNYRKLIVLDHCNRCPSKRKLLVHHRDRNRANNATTNLEVLCYSCNTIEHFNDHAIKDDLLSL